MKRICILFLTLCANLLTHAQATDLVIDNQTPGWLSSKINYGDQQTVKNLKVTGYINATDLLFIGQMVISNSLNGQLDLSNVNIVAETIGADNNTLGTNSFGCKSQYKGHLNKLVLPNTVTKLTNCLGDYMTIDTLNYTCKTKHISNNLLGKSLIKYLIIGENVDSIPDEGLNGRKGLKYVEFPSTIKHIGNAAFSACYNMDFNIQSLSNIKYLGTGAFGSTAFRTDTLYVPSNLTTLYLDAFPFVDGEHVYFDTKIDLISEGKFNLNGACNMKDLFPKNITGFDRGETATGIIFHMKRETPPTINYNLSYYVDTVYIPKGSKSTYQALKYKGFDWWNQQNLVEQNPLKAMTFNADNLNLEKLQVKQISISFTPSDADDKSVVWSVEDPTIASVDENGVVTALKPGKTKVTATSTPTGIQASCEITVIQHVTGITMDYTSLSLNLGETKQLGYTIEPEDATDKSVSWTSSNPSICSVTESGNLIATASGTSIIIAITSDGSLPVTCVVTVSESTGIDYVTSSEEIISDIYTISGIKIGKNDSSLKSLPKGIYIIKGKKVVVK